MSDFDPDALLARRRGRGLDLPPAAPSVPHPEPDNSRFKDAEYLARHADRHVEHLTPLARLPEPGARVSVRGRIERLWDLSDKQRRIGIVRSGLIVDRTGRRHFTAWRDHGGPTVDVDSTVELRNAMVVEFRGALDLKVDSRAVVVPV